MEFKMKSDGTRIYDGSFKKQILDELLAGNTPAELGRKYQVPVQNILKWKKKQTEFTAESEAKVENTVPVSEYKKLLEEVKLLKRSLVNMTVDRDILKEAVDIATKKKWI